MYLAGGMATMQKKSHTHNGQLALPFSCNITGFKTTKSMGSMLNVMRFRLVAFGAVSPELSGEKRFSQFNPVIAFPNTEMSN